VFNLAINVLGAYVHSSRLQYIEFFSKFYDSGGRAFSPLKVKTTYVELEDM
jgi:V/A-type H+-transporting ATPase subunit I